MKIAAIRAAVEKYSLDELSKAEEALLEVDAKQKSSFSEKVYIILHFLLYTETNCPNIL